MSERDPQTYAIIGVAMRVHNELGCGFLEAVYQEALEVELAAANIPFEREALLQINYRGAPLRCMYKADFICYESVIVELKALAKLENVHHAQVINYLKASSHPRGLLINFGGSSLEYKRFAGNTHGNSSV